MQRQQRCLYTYLASVQRGAILTTHAGVCAVARSRRRRNCRRRRRRRRRQQALDASAACAGGGRAGGWVAVAVARLLINRSRHAPPPAQTRRTVTVTLSSRVRRVRAVATAYPTHASCGRLYIVVAYVSTNSGGSRRSCWGKGIWDAVDTSPDLGGSKCPHNLGNGYSTEQAADANGIREKFLSLDVFSLTFKNIFFGEGGRSPPSPLYGSATEHELLFARRSPDHRGSDGPG